MEKNRKSGTQFLLRMTAGEAIQLNAIAKKLNITKSDVLRLSLSSSFLQKNKNQDAVNADAAETLDAISDNVNALGDRMENVELLLGNAIDLLLAMSQNSTTHEPQPAVSVQQETQKPAPPSWSAYVKKYQKTNPVMSDQSWNDFLKKRFTDEHGQPPDLST